VYGLGLLSAVVLSGVALARTLGGGAVIEYGLAAPDDRVIYVGVDVAHIIHFIQNEPFAVRSYAMTNIAPDGRQVVSMQSGGNTDLFLKELDGTQHQLTHFTDFPAKSGERDARRANLYPSWSPNASWIAFISSDVKGRLDLYAVHPDGSGLHHVGDRIRAAMPYTPRWIRFDSELPVQWLIGCAASVLFLLWLFKGYNRSGSYTG
jgi:hypothetical protein